MAVFKSRVNSKGDLIPPSGSNELRYYTSNDNLYQASGYGLPNCVAWAWGRFYELTGERPMFNATDAEKWYAKVNQPDYNYEKGQTPRLGAIACWQKGIIDTDTEDDGGGHVAIVEKIIDENTIITSESAWSGTKWYSKQRDNSDSNWGLSGYDFQGFIYPPVTFDDDPNINAGPTLNTNIGTHTQEEREFFIWCYLVSCCEKDMGQDQAERVAAALMGNWKVDSRLDQLALENNSVIKGPDFARAVEMQFDENHNYVWTENGLRYGIMYSNNPVFKRKLAQRTFRPFLYYMNNSNGGPQTGQSYKYTTGLMTQLEFIMHWLYFGPEFDSSYNQSPQELWKTLKNTTAIGDLVTEIMTNVQEINTSINNRLNYASQFYNSYEGKWREEHRQLIISATEASSFYYNRGSEENNYVTRSPQFTISDTDASKKLVYELTPIAIRHKSHEGYSRRPLSNIEGVMIHPNLEKAHYGIEITEGGVYYAAEWVDPAYNTKATGSDIYDFKYIHISLGMNRSIEDSVVPSAAVAPGPDLMSHIRYVSLNKIESGSSHSPFLDELCNLIAIIIPQPPDLLSTPLPAIVSVNEAMNNNLITPNSLPAFKPEDFQQYYQSPWVSDAIYTRWLCADYLDKAQLLSPTTEIEASEDIAYINMYGQFVEGGKDDTIVSSDITVGDNTLWPDTLTKLADEYQGKSLPKVITITDENYDGYWYVTMPNNINELGFVQDTSFIIEEETK